jgi:hypothetical protein
MEHDKKEPMYQQSEPDLRHFAKSRSDSMDSMMERKLFYWIIRLPSRYDPVHRFPYRPAAGIEWHGQASQVELVKEILARI